jgi:hypothetical protein
MDSTSKTISYLRRLTFDGMLTGQEVWTLGRFFNDNPEYTKGWPGEILAPMLESAFDDGQLTEEEMTLLAETISSIESEWRGKNPCAQAEEDADQPIVVYPALIPVLDQRYEIQSPRDEQTFVVTLCDHACTCPDWQRRKPLSAQHPGKCCKHVAHAFTRTGKVFEPWFQALLDDCFERARGTDPEANWLLLEIPESKPALLAGGGSPWCNILAPGEDGYEAFSFNTKKRRWSYGQTPKRAGLVERAIQNNFAISAA